MSATLPDLSQVGESSSALGERLKKNSRGRRISDSNVGMAFDEASDG